MKKNLIQLLTMMILLCGFATKAAAASPMEYPLYFGKPKAPNTVIIYHNIQCSPSQSLWPEVVRLMPMLNPDETKIILQGGGFDDNGHQAMLAANILAEQNQELACAFLTAVGKAGKAPFEKPLRWAITWAEKKPSFDKKRFQTFWNTDSNTKRVKGKNAIRDKYKTTGTPTVIINGKVYTGHKTALAMSKAIKESKPYNRLP